MRKSISLLALPLVAAGIAVPLVGASAATQTPRLTGGVEHLYLASTCANCNNSPIIGSVPNGVTMTVTPVVSADRRYVRMTLSPFFNANNGFTTFQFPSLGAVGGSGLGGAGAIISPSNPDREVTCATEPD